MDTPHGDAGRPLGLLVKVFPKLSETFVLEEVLGLERLGVALRVYTLAAAADALASGATARVRAPIVQVPAGWRLVPGLVRALLTHPLACTRALPHAARRGRRGLADFARAAWLAARMRRDGVAQLHVHFISSPADVAELAARIAGTPFSISAHAKDIYLSPAADLQRKLRAARFTVTCTEFNRRTLAALAPEAQVHRMYHGVDHARLAAQTRHGGERPLILSVGRLREKKGLDTLIDACALLRDRGLGFRCEIVGYGEARDALLARIAAHRLDGQLRLTGKLAHAQVIERHAQAAVYVQPSRVAADGDRDGIPNVLLEAMSIGTPVVASAVSGIPELVVHEANGLLVPPDDPARLADAIARLLADAALGERLAAAARATVTERFDNDRNLRLLLDLLDDSHAPALCPAA